MVIKPMRSAKNKLMKHKNTLRSRFSLMTDAFVLKETLRQREIQG